MSHADEVICVSLPGMYPLHSVVTPVSITKGSHYYRESPEHTMIHPSPFARVSCAEGDGVVALSGMELFLLPERLKSEVQFSEESVHDGTYFLCDNAILSFCDRAHGIRGMWWDSCPD